VSAGHHAKAVTLLVRAGEPARALELLLQHEVPLSEELAEALTPEKTPDNADSRSAVLMRIAQVRHAVQHVFCACPSLIIWMHACSSRYSCLQLVTARQVARSEWCLQRLNVIMQPSE
jgi:hypothetical protein